MERFEQQAVETPEETGGESSVDTQIEVDLICGGVGFDDGPADDTQWITELHNQQKSKLMNKEA